MIRLSSHLIRVIVRLQVNECLKNITNFEQPHIFIELAAVVRAKKIKRGANVETEPDAKCVNNVVIKQKHPNVQPIAMNKTSFVSKAKIVFFLICTHVKPA